MQAAVHTSISRSAIPLCAALLMGAAYLPGVVAQTFPAKPVRSVAPYSPEAAPTR